MKMRWLVLAFIVLSMASCLKEESPVSLPPQGDAISQTLRMGSDYSTQYYYDLTNQKVVHTSKVNSWHLAFESGEDGETVFINGGNGMGLIKTNKTDFREVSSNDYAGITWLQDNPNGIEKEAAFAGWNQNELSRNTIYIVRLDGSNQNIVTVKLREVTSTYFQFEVGDLTHGKLGAYQINKEPTRMYTYFNLEDLEERKDVEPIKESWDLLFTRYGFTFYNETPPLPYIVTGVLTNPNSKAYKDSLNSFYDIDAGILTNCELSPHRDIIGYDWKYYDFDLGIFHIRQDYNYIIRTQNENCFKLRFLSFYDDNGLKGTPTFEFKQIQ